MKILKVMLSSLFILAVVLTLAVPKPIKADSVPQQIIITVKVNSYEPKIGKKLKLTVYVKDENGKKIRDSGVYIHLAQEGNMAVSQLDSTGSTNRKGSYKFRISTDNFIPSIPCNIYILANHPYYPSVGGSAHITVYPRDCPTSIWEHFIKYWQNLIWQENS
jgi:hypothetical protein